MPFNQPQLPAELVAKVVDWLRTGAPYDAPIEVAKTQVKSDHWAFQKPVRGAFAQLSGPLASWSKNPVDILLAAKWQEKGLQPSSERTLAPYFGECTSM